jgi:hypothetical protein
MSKGPIFLAASVPERDLHLYVTDPIAIREAIRALVAETVRERLLVFGGHPAISPLVEHAARSLNAVDNVRIYQSEFFRKVVPPVAQKFKNLVWTPEVPGNRDASLTLMRTQMITSEPFEAGVFIGGMDGLDEEWQLFTRNHPNAPAFPVASTEGAARLIWNSWTPPASLNLPANVKDRLAQDLDYRLLFRDLLG